MNRWDKLFLEICTILGNHSRCLSRKIGSICVKDKTILATGYNGPSRGISHCGPERIKSDHRLYIALRHMSSDGTIKDWMSDRCPRYALGFESGQGLEWCLAAHAERNCIANAARIGVPLLGSTLYLNDIIPCSTCLPEIINAGINQVVVTEHKFYDELSEYIVYDSGLLIRTFEGGVL